MAAVLYLIIFFASYLLPYTLYLFAISLSLRALRILQFEY